MTLLSPFTANAALSATTAEVINGTAPYLTFNGGATKVTTTAELLGITLSDGTAYTQTNSSTAGNPIELPVAGQTVADIGMLVPATTSPESPTDPTQKVNLSTLIGAPNNYWGDDDGDGQGVGGITATGDLSVKITDALGNAIKRSDALSACNSPYLVELTSTPGNLTTQYGTPNVTPFTGDTAKYYIKPKIGNPYACFAQPNLQYGKTTESTYWGPTSQWDPEKGFKVQNLGNPSSNFPTTGSKNLYFNLTIAGAVWSDVTYSKTPSDSGLDLTITGSGNVAKVLLTGPGNGATVAQTATVKPTTFTLYSDAGKTNVIYSFTISKWFIARPGAIANNAAAANFCTALGNGFHQPLRSEYTNSSMISLPNCQGNGSDSGTCSGGNYTRAIGGGLFAEWGRTYSGYYTSSDWDSNYFWASEAFSGSYQYAVSSNLGFVNYYSPSTSINRAACVRL